MKRTVLSFVFAVICAVAAKGQGFLNLDFESAYNLPGNPPVPDGTDVGATSALPDWTVYDGDVVLSEINYVSNYFYGEATSIELEGGILALGGTFSTELFIDSSISQTGMVPVDAESLIFDAEGPDGLNHTVFHSGFSITLGGQTLAYTLLSQATGYSVYGANIPAGLDGQVEGLTLACQGAGSGLVVLDNIEFSPTSVPEPSKFTFIGLGAVLFGLVRYRNGRARRWAVCRRRGR
jgi:hypothetical protein